MTGQRWQARAAQLSLLAVLGLLMVALGGCASEPDLADEAGRSPAAATDTAFPEGVDLSANEVAARLREQISDYDHMYRRVDDMSPVKETYGIDLAFPETAAGGELAAQWMQVPDVDGGFAFALYDTSLVEIQVWIAPTPNKATLPDRHWGSSAQPIVGEINGHQALFVPREWVSEQAIRYPGAPTVAPAHWSHASVSWAQGQCVITISSTERDVEDLLGVAEQVKITGEVTADFPGKAQ